MNKIIATTPGLMARDAIITFYENGEYKIVDTIRNNIQTDLSNSKWMLTEGGLLYSNDMTGRKWCKWSRDDAKSIISQILTHIAEKELLG